MSANRTTWGEGNRESRSTPYLDPWETNGLRMMAHDPGSKQTTLDRFLIYYWT